MLISAITALAAVGCGGDEGPDLSPAADEGRALMRSNGCASCHGANGQGGVGPALEGVYGSEVELDDGTTVIAERDYLHESIVDPDAKRVDGYRLKMPTNNLTDDEVERIVDYIVEIGGEDAAS